MSKWSRFVDSAKSRHHQARRWWWDHANGWLLTMLIRFVKALVILVLWLLVAWGIFYLILLPVLDRLEVAAKETIALLGALLTALIGFVIQQWKGMEEEERERQRRREEALAEVASLGTVLQHGEFDEAVKRYKDLCNRTQPPWRDRTVRGELEAVWQKEAPSELQEWVRLCNLPDTKLMQDLSSRATEMTKAILWAFKNLRVDGRKAPEQLKRLLESEETEKVLQAVEGILAGDENGVILLRDPILNDSFKKLADRSTIQELVLRIQAVRRQPSASFTLWQEEERPIDSPEIAHGAEMLGLRLNPFGPERAELDPLLKEYGIRPDRLWDQIRGARSVAVFGPPGSGKTALALLLAYDCGDPPADPREKGAFPVYNVFWPGGAEGEGRPALDWVARGGAETLLQVVAGKPHGFAALDPVGQAACAFLWCYSLGAASPEDLIPHFQRAGAPDAPALLESVRTVMGGARLGSQPDEITLLDLLGKARPTGYTCTYVLVDLETESGSGWAQPALDLVQSLLDYTIHLEMRKVYVKLFLPERLRHFLGDHLPIEVVHLEWEREDLAEMLKSRLVHIGLSSLAQVYSDPDNVCPDPDGRLVEAAKGSPRRLVRLGNEMLARVQTAPIRPDHLPRG
jgi:hypothetical protein